MSIDKWLSKNKVEIEKKKPKREYSPEEIQEGKKQRINELLGKKVNKKPKKQNNNVEEPSDDFFSYFLQFKDWLDKRTYLKGDIEKIETWILNLSQKIKTEIDLEEESRKNISRKELSEEFRDIPPNFIEEKMRIAINKKLRTMKMTNSDTYYLKKLKKIIQVKLSKAQYYEILKKIID